MAFLFEDKQDNEQALLESLSALIERFEFELVEFKEANRWF